MALFASKRNALEAQVEKIEKTTNAKNERPRICCLDISNEVITSLELAGANIYEGTLGAKIKVPNNGTRDGHYVLLNHNFPVNIHEFDIIILDLDNFKTIEYKNQDHSHEMHTGKTAFSFLSSYPETLFDPRPVSSSILRNLLQDISNRKFLVIAFATSDYSIEYDIVKNNQGYREKQNPLKHSIYDFWKYVPTSNSKFGREITINKMSTDFQNILEKYKTDTFYNQTFSHPNKWVDNKNSKDEKYFPLMFNINGDIISYTEKNNFENLILLPQIKDKSNFLHEFLFKIAPSFYPELFPYATTFSWKEEESYWLPNHAALLNKKESIRQEFEQKLAIVDSNIKNNILIYSFLH